MELEYLKCLPKFVKELKPTDLDSRLVLSNEILLMVPHAGPERDTPIRVLDDEGDDYLFCLSLRKGPHLKPVFQAKGWKTFIKKRGAKIGDKICFWPEVNAIKRTDYRIQLIPFSPYLSPNPEGLSSSRPSAPAEEHETLAIWAASGLAL